MLLRAMLVALLAVPACSGDTRDSSNAPIEHPRSSPSADAELRAALEAYADCLRGEGVDASDPSFDESGRIDSWPSYAPTSSARAAEEACNGEVSEIAFRPRGEAAVFLERARQFAECMAAEGVTNVEIGLDGIRIGPPSGNREISAAERACRHFMGGS